ncbi:MAG TPA: hypothetical protein VNT75_11910 [Symbiobacteriaceae bacterium]|nr:hypothetical protein [Symbiobacteriaceae bacterium]
MTISWETVLVALIQAAATVSTAWIERCRSKKGQPRRKSSRRSTSES